MTSQRDRSLPSTVDETIATIREHCQPLDPECVPLAQTLGRVLREAAWADTDQPPFDRSSVDGYAVRIDDRSTRFRVVDEIRAGDWKPRALQPGETVRIATGGALPDDRLQVVMKEHAREEDGRLVVVDRGSEPNIRRKGEDAKQGQELVGVGTTLAPGALALMASVGCTEPRVTQLPNVLHLATGNEIVPPDQKPERGQIRDSNSTLVRAFFCQSGIEPTQIRAGEDRTAIQSALQSAIRNPQSAIERVDLLVISGGASVGEHDFTRSLLEELGFTIHVSRTTTRPGKPMIFGSRGNAAAFGLPGNPLAHFVCLNLYVRQALWRFSGARQSPDFCQGVLAAEFGAHSSERETLWPARMNLVEGEAHLTPLRWQSSGDLTSLAKTNALARVAPNQGTLSRGTRLPFLPT
jgi:molybdopterin molybdotransferase